MPLMHPSTQPEEPHGKDRDCDHHVGDFSVILAEQSRCSAAKNNTNYKSSEEQINYTSGDDCSWNRHGEKQESSYCCCSCETSLPAATTVCI